MPAPHCCVCLAPPPLPLVPGGRFGYVVTTNMTVASSVEAFGPTAQLDFSVALAGSLSFANVEPADIALDVAPASIVVKVSIAVATLETARDVKRFLQTMETGALATVLAVPVTAASAPVISTVTLMAPSPLATVNPPAAPPLGTADAAAALTSGEGTQQQQQAADERSATVRGLIIAIAVVGFLLVAVLVILHRNRAALPAMSRPALRPATPAKASAPEPSWARHEEAERALSFGGGTAVSK